jgi:hypothetical protein
MRYARGVGRFVALLLPAIAAAEPGVIEVNQARALAGGVSAGDAPDFPVTLSEPGIYRLTGNLTAPAVNVGAIAITSSDVTLDLGGFALLGLAQCTGASLGITCAVPASADGIASTSGSVTNVLVRNGSVRGFRIGVAIAGDSARVENLRALRNSGSGIAIGGGAAQVTSCTANLNNGEGIDVGLDARVEQSQAVGNAGDGINASFNALLRGNVANFNGGDGLFAEQGSNVAGNTAADNVELGLRMTTGVGYAGNVLDGNNAGATPQIQLTGGTRLGDNLCNGVIC